MFDEANLALRNGGGGRARPHGAILAPFRGAGVIGSDLPTVSRVIHRILQISGTGVLIASVLLSAASSQTRSRRR
jgi:hypothetical protein